MSAYLFNKHFISWYRCVPETGLHSEERGLGLETSYSTRKDVDWTMRNHGGNRLTTSTNNSIHEKVFNLGDFFF
jgi:hypothetical protein